jgi:hypothetical protein
MLNRAGAQVDDGLDVYPHLPDFGVDRRLLDRADRADAGVVHEDVDGQAAVGDLVEQSGARIGVGDVSADRLHSHRPRQLGGQVPQPVFAAGDQGDAVPACRQFTSDVGADARRCSGDDGGARR